MSYYVKDVYKNYGNSAVLKGLSAEFDEGKITCILGGSGSGKTTLFNVMAGIIKCDGEVKMPGEISYIFQTPRLIPTMSVYANMEYVLRKTDNKEIRKGKIDKILDMLELTGKAVCLPAELSGGEAQRVSMGRAFLYSAPLLIMDEPFGALDIGLKYRLIEKMCKLLEEDKKTVVFVTHDIDEALLLGDRFSVLKNGIIYDTFDIDLPRENRDIGCEVLNDVRKRLLKNLI